MKNLICLPIGVCIVLIAFLPGCDKPLANDNHQDCDEEYIVGLNMFSATEYEQYKDGLVFGDNSNYYKTNYETVGDSAQFTLELEVFGLCNSYDPNLNFQLILLAEDSTVTATGFLDEINNGAYHDEFYLNPQGTYYNDNHDHSFQQEPNGNAEALRLRLHINFPKLGSFSADSAYFFSNLSSARVGLLGKHPK